MKIIALVPGSYDPFTNGHEELVRKACAMYDQVHVVIANNPDKKYFLGDGVLRAAVVKGVLADVLPAEQFKRVTVVVLSKRLLGDYATEVGATVNLRGLRNSMDFQYEYNMQAVNNEISPSLTTVYVATNADKAHISSSMVRGLIQYQNGFEQVSKFVHPLVSIQLKITQEAKLG